MAAESQWFIRLGSDEMGPISHHELRHLAQQGAIKPQTPISLDKTAWRDAATVDGLSFGQFRSGQTIIPQRGNEWLKIGKSQARTIVNDFQNMDLRSEIVPIDSQNLPLLVRDSAFWGIGLLGAFPLVIAAINPELQLIGFSLFFAAVWAVIFKQFVLKYEGSWKLPLLTLFFTGIVGINALLIIYCFLPQFYVNMPSSKDHLVSLLGFVFQVGILEEVFKFLPVVGYVVWKRTKADPLMIVVMGVFSGLGFAAFENVKYSAATISSTLNTANAMEAAATVHGGIIESMTRSLSCVFGHAVYSGIFAYFLAAAFVLKRRWGALILTGLLVSAVIHGVYDWLWRIQPLFPALITLVALMLFYGYIAKLRGMILLAHAGQATEQQP